MSSHHSSPGLRTSVQNSQDSLAIDSPTIVNTSSSERKPESLSSLSTADGYYEAEPNAWEWIKEKTPTGKDVGHYVYGLFPFTHWITRYNVQWLSGDLIAGLTVACVVVPQSMAYAKLATLAPEYGLYSSFMGVLIYWFFATSKDITIGVCSSLYR